MIDLLLPGGLFALAALAVPLLIHLLSRRPSRTVRVGSIRFLQPSISQRFRSLRLSDWPLLLLRAAIIALLALLLARPVIRTSGLVGEAPAGWILVEPQALPITADDSLWPMLDSLAAGDFSLRLLAPGFEPVAAEVEVTEHAGIADIWSLLREADLLLAAGRPIHVVAAPRLAALQGERPQLAREVVWHPVDGMARASWLQAARYLGADSLLVTAGETSTRGTRFVTEVLAAPPQPARISHQLLPELRYAPGDAGETASLTLAADAKNRQQLDVMAAMPVCTVRIEHESSRMHDAGYLEAAVRAAAAIYCLPVHLVVTVPAESESGPASLVFRLGITSGAMRQRGAEGGVYVDDAHQLSSAAPGSAMLLDTDAGGAAIDLLMRDEVECTAGLTVWFDNYGRCLLDVRRQGAALRYTFHSRFHPEAGGLVLHPAFPDWIASLLLQATGLEQQSSIAAGGPDHRETSVRQAMPGRRDAMHSQDTGATASRRLHLPLWILTAVLFITERVVSARTGK